MGSGKTPVYHPHTQQPAAPATSPAPATSSSSGGSSSGGGGASSNPYASYMAQQRKAQHSAAQKYLDQAHTIAQQVAALQAALGPDGFKHALDIQLANIGLDQRQADQILRATYGEQVDVLKKTASDNTKAAGGQSYLNLVNHGRERANALTEAMANGAGESDMLRAQQMALDNWNANQNEVNRSFHDTQTSINSSLADLTASARTDRMNVARQAESDRAQLWRTYYDQMAETQNNLGNTYGAMANAYGAANEMVHSKKTRAKQHRADQQSAAAFMGESVSAGSAYKSPGIPKALMRWEGAAPIDGGLEQPGRQSGLTTISAPKPEGASLRSWT